jgi:peptide/nickel transport system substrate-binding protein
MNRYLYRNGEGERAFLPLPAASWGYDPTLENLIPPYDPLAAKLALIDAGYPDGFDTRIYVTNAPVRVAAAQALGRYWKEHLNVSAEVVVSEWGDFSAAVTRGDLPVYGMSWNWNSDPYFFLDNLFHSQAQNPLGNGAGFSSPTVDSFLDQAVTTSDQTARAAFYRNALTAIVAQDPLLVYATEKSTYAFSKKVHGFVLRPDRLNTFCTNEVNVWLAK